MKHIEQAAEPQKRQRAKSDGRVLDSAQKQAGTAQKPCVYVGMSGGVDSSVTAMLLKEQGYKVVGVYMKNWSKSLPGFPCPWKEDYQDAKRVAVQLGIDFKLFDFEEQYFDKVVKYMIEGFEAGITPNPDIMCNQEIKFKLFLESCLEDGADLIATGHYAKIKNGRLFMAKDKNKDQTYFLYRTKRETLAKTLFPLGDLTKTEVRALAKKHNLSTAEKKESMGICFVGRVGIKEFLAQYVKTKPGKIIDQNGKAIGTHDGAIFYTIGQRHGLEIGGGLPYYVVGKNMRTNEVFVTTKLDDDRLWANELNLTSVHWIDGSSKVGDKVEVRGRHRAELVDATVTAATKTQLKLKLDTPIRAATPGQSAVIYSAEECLGGGVVTG